MKKIFFLIGILFSIIGCIEDPKDEGYATIDGDVSGKLIVMNTDSSSVFANIDFYGFHQLGPSVNIMNETSSFEFILTDSTDSVIYYHKDINFDNYQKYYDRTPFRVENWEKISKYKYIYHIKASDFD